MKSQFTQKLMRWNRSQNKRSMPWKGEKDPYKIWLSEVILQQTRVEQGWEYYRKFLKTFPTIHHLANAPAQKVFKLWEGLGYYSRCKNLHETAKLVVEKFKGNFPSSYDEIRGLRGIGPYTASAIASFAFNLPYAVVDGNVQRVISRYFGINAPVNSAAGKKLYLELADSLLDQRAPGLYNQAIMDFGATICKPRNPLCRECVQRKECQAFRHGWVTTLPVKEKSVKRKNRWFTYYLVEWKNQVYIRRRNGKDIWADLYELILNESIDAFEQKETARFQVITKTLGTSDFRLRSISPLFKQQLTHQTIYGQFISVTIDRSLPGNSYQLVRKKDLRKFPFPKLINSYLEQELIQSF